MGHRNPTVWTFKYSFNPYDATNTVIVKTERSLSSTLPEGTLHMDLQCRVSFMPYPTHEFRANAPTVRKDEMVRLFIGQLPYQVTDMQLQWLCYTFGRGASVHFPERIVKKDATRGGKVPTGCVHAYVEASAVEGLMFAMHKRVFVDDTGVWYAQTPEEVAALDEYCNKLKMDKRRRFQNRPYDSIVVQHAVSTFVPPPPAYNVLFTAPVAATAVGSQASSTPPPEYQSVAYGEELSR
jgi:hypothetical protein